MYAADWLGKRAELTPNQLALIDELGSRRLTYLEMQQRAETLVSFLYHELGLREGDRLVIMAWNRLEHLDLLFAAQKLSAIFVPLNVRLSVPEIESILRDCQPKILFYGAEMNETLGKVASPDNLQFVRLDGKSVMGSPGEPNRFEKWNYEQIIGYGCREFPRPQRTMESVWLILYTGGTTGLPKGAVLNQGMVTWNAINTAVSWQLSAADIAPVFTPFFHTGGLNVLATPLLHLGGTLILSGPFQPGRALESISRERATLVFMVPTMFQMMAQEAEFSTADLSSVRFCISGGAPCPSSIYETYWAKGLVFKQGYGLTEAGPNCFSLHSDDVQRKQGSIGKPVFHSEVKLVDVEGREVATNQVGELLIQGNHLAAGYWQNPEATAATFRKGWVYTGDLACRDEEGYYSIVGRKKELIISGGENIYPAEVEAVLNSHPDVTEVAVIGVAHEKWGEVPKAFLVLRTENSVTEEEVIRYCQRHLASYKVPKEVEFRSVLPHSAAGKLLKRELS
ncbi:class I adenylate-forming enzyme family protein [Desulfosporosinus sp. BICA1-9]|uniref:class I adenylate-forming enzyme family protein n=1 Tax=Desulfosporosinus sp. BICA1-9 TaxID=1531958 RepID=UPI00054C3EE7|nr:long-chain fatty acid--CoA ligase [Desulfosporosinus sp. BICA1-9]KJS47351.1 MAG: hypothetical protein VR66_20155 [Peptococcaceae bacterium BRH_c23]KJS90217.1 MAG: hypothetical protein JL57_03300 [Desulfosporosinus sp. BICA1-9]HBW37052.1 long-chain fatty acid--CoA ligase [Desulfosporosinus sp.]